MQRYKSILIYGFALFAMFFGSGNLVFPIKIGQSTGSFWFLGFLGLFVTGILLPFLGLFVIKLHKGSYNSFFAQAGPIAKIALPLFTLSLLGSFGVVPVHYGGPWGDGISRSTNSDEYFEWFILYQHIFLLS